MKKKKEKKRKKKKKEKRGKKGKKKREKEIPTKFHQNPSKNQWKEFKNNEFLQILPKNAKKIDEKFLKY